MRGACRRIWAMLYRHLALYRGSWPRIVEMAYWPVLQMCIWGFTSQFLATRTGTPAALGAAALLGGVLLWEIALRTQMGVAVSFLEEVWSRNLGHVFVSPLRPWELVTALLGVSLARTVMGVVPAALLAWLLYAFDLLMFGPLLLLFFVNLIVMGWAISLAVVSLILRHGQGAEALAWSVMFGLTPLSAVFYPVAVLPAAVRPIAWLLPSAHVFEGMRAVLRGEATPWGHLALAAGLNVMWIVVAALVFARQFHAARVRGALLSMGE